MGKCKEDRKRVKSGYLPLWLPHTHIAAGWQQFSSLGQFLCGGSPSLAILPFFLS
jgi:hypothetical protein